MEMARESREPITLALDAGRLSSSRRAVAVGFGWLALAAAVCCLAASGARGAEDEHTWSPRWVAPRAARDSNGLHEATRWNASSAQRARSTTVVSRGGEVRRSNFTAPGQSPRSVRTVANDEPIRQPTLAPPLMVQSPDMLPEEPQGGRFTLPAAQPQRREPAPLASPMNSPMPDEFAQITVDCAEEFRKLKPINSLTNKIEASPGNMPPECGSPDNPYLPRNWQCTEYNWTATNLCHKPLYFEEIQLERYGHALRPGLQTAYSGAHFFACTALLPYSMAMNPMYECQYALGYYRPGSCAPYMIQPFPLSIRGAAAQAAVIVGGIIVIP